MEIQITNYNTPLDTFNALLDRFPEGEYKQSDGNYWFNISIRDQNGLQLTWFLDNDGVKSKILESE